MNLKDENMLTSYSLSDIARSLSSTTNSAALLIITANGGMGSRYRSELPSHMTDAVISAPADDDVAFVSFDLTRDARDYIATVMAKVPHGSLMSVRMELTINGRDGVETFDTDQRRAA